MNILQVEDMIKGLPDDRLMMEAQSPSGNIPQFLTISEIQRRSDMRERFKNQQQQDNGTVADQVKQKGIAALPQQMPPQMPQQMPQQPMYGGGRVRMQMGGVVPGGLANFLPYLSANVQGGGAEAQGASSASDIYAGIGSLSDPFSYSMIDQRVRQAPDLTGAYPDLTDLIAGQKKDAWANAMVQLGAGIAGGDLPGGLSRAGLIGMRGKESARELEIANRVAKAKAAKEAATEAEEKSEREKIKARIKTIVESLPEEKRLAFETWAMVDPEEAIGTVAGTIMEGAEEYSFDITDLDQGATDILVATFGQKPKYSDGEINFAVRTNAKKVELDQAGNARLIDQITGDVTHVPIKGGTADQEVPKPPEGETLYDLAKDAFGLGPNIKGMAGRVIDVMPGGSLPEWAKANTRAREKFSTSVRDLIRALRETRAFKEYEYIQRELNIMPSMLSGDETAEERIGALRGTLETMLQQSERDAGDPSLGDAINKEAKQDVVEIRNFLATLGGPESGSESEREELERLRRELGGG